MPVELTRLGIESLDADHARLVDIIAELNTLYESGGEHGEAVRLIVSLFAESGAHFGREEEEMERTSYPLAAAHREEHGNLVEALRSIAAEFEAKRTALDGTLVQDLWEWLNHHMTSTDRAFAEYLHSLAADRC